MENCGKRDASRIRMISCIGAATARSEHASNPNSHKINGAPKYPQAALTRDHALEGLGFGVIFNHEKFFFNQYNMIQDILL